MGTATTLIASLLLSISGVLAGLFAVYTQMRDRRRSIHRQQSEIDKLEKTIELDETTRQRLSAEAAQIGAEQRIATERWWKEQFDAVKDELVEEQKIRRKEQASRRAEQASMRNLSRWADEHQRWDERAWKLAVKTDPDYPPPPKLDHAVQEPD